MTSIAITREQPTYRSLEAKAEETSPERKIEYFLRVMNYDTETNRMKIVFLNLPLSYGRMPPLKVEGVSISVWKELCSDRIRENEAYIREHNIKGIDPDFPIIDLPYRYDEKILLKRKEEATIKKIPE